MFRHLKQSMIGYKILEMNVEKGEEFRAKYWTSDVNQFRSSWARIEDLLEHRDDLEPMRL